MIPMQLAFFAQHSVSEIQPLNLSAIKYSIVRRYHNLFTQSAFGYWVGSSFCYCNNVAVNILKYLS